VRALDPHHTRQELQPARVNAKKLFFTGSACWLAALTVVGALHLLGRPLDGRLALMCLTGLLLGALGYVWAHATQREQPDL
jgi:hypothetical protein